MIQKNYGHERIWVGYYHPNGNLVVPEGRMKDERGAHKELETDTEYVRIDLFEALEHKLLKHNESITQSATAPLVKRITELKDGLQEAVEMIEAAVEYAWDYLGIDYKDDKIAKLRKLIR